MRPPPAPRNRGDRRASTYVETDFPLALATEDDLIRPNAERLLAELVPAEDLPE